MSILENKKEYNGIGNKKEYNANLYLHGELNSLIFENN